MLCQMHLVLHRRRYSTAHGNMMAMHGDDFRSYMLRLFTDGRAARACRGRMRPMWGRKFFAPCHCKSRTTDGTAAADFEHGCGASLVTSSGNSVERAPPSHSRAVLMWRCWQTFRRTRPVIFCKPNQRLASHNGLWKSCKRILRRRRGSRSGSRRLKSKRPPISRPTCRCPSGPFDRPNTASSGGSGKNWTISSDAATQGLTTGYARYAPQSSANEKSRVALSSKNR